MKIAYSYQRWSTKSQTDRDSSIRQTNSAKQWMRDYGTTLGYTLSADGFVDAGRSGYKGSHIAVDDTGKAKGDLMRFIQTVEEGKISRDSILLIDEISRFSRLPLSEAVPLFMSVINLGIGLVFTSSFDRRVITKELINRDGYLLPAIVADLFRVNSESVEKGKKIKAAKQTMLEDIRKGVVYRNNLPKFFTFVPDVPTNPKCRTGKYVHNELTGTLKQLIDMFLAGKAMYSIALELNRKEKRTFKGGEWSGNSINKILRNRILMGEYKGVKNYVEPVVDEPTFTKIQNILNQNTFNRGKVGALINIFRGVCFCAHCNSKMSIMSTAYRGNTYRYLRCNALTRGKIKCDNKSSIPLPEMELEFFCDFLFKTPTELLNDGDSKEIKQLKDSIAKKQLTLTKLTTQIKTLVALSESMDIDELKTQLSTLNKEREAVKTDLDSLNLKLSSVQDSPNTFDSLQKLVLDFADRNNKFLDKLLANVDSVTDEECLANRSANKKAYAQHEQIKEQVVKSLQDNYTREGIRVMLPPLIGKITIDTTKGQFYVYNRMGKLIYKSQAYTKKQNSTDKWVQGIKDYWNKKRTKVA